MTRRPHQNRELIQKILGSEYLDLKIASLRLDEDFGTGTSKVNVETIGANDFRQTVEGEGCGLVDALFNGLLGRYAIEYQSLKTIALANFSVNARLDTKKEHSGVDALGEVTIEVRNSDGNRFTFSDESRSIVSSTALAVLAVVEYFVNAERAFITLHRSLRDAKDRNRSDLVTRYTRELAEVVKSTSYAEVIEHALVTSGVRNKDA